MRIAVLIYGRLNHCAEQYETIVKAIGNHTIDFFVSSNNSPVIKDFIKIYKPISYDNNKIIKIYDLSKYPHKRYETNLHNMCLHFINKERVFGLLENHIHKTNIHYDVVMSLIVDVIIQNHFEFNIKENIIYIPIGFDWVKNGMNDQIAYGSYQVMSKYNTIYRNILYLLDNHLSIPHPESLNYAHLKYHKLNVERINLKYFMCIHRKS